MEYRVPGNHELYTLASQKETGARGLAKYMECVTVARSWGVLTPEGTHTEMQDDLKRC